LERVNRREFLKILGAGGLSLTLGSCGREEKRILYSSLLPENEMIPGIPRWFISVCRECPAGCGLLVKNREGRSIKLEGSPSHPVNRGALCARGQAALQGLYHPDRIKRPFRRNRQSGVQIRSWEEAEKELAERIREVTGNKDDKSIAYLGSPVGDTLRGLITDWFERLGSQKVYFHEPYDHSSLIKANELTFGIRDVPEYDFSEAKLLLSFGADFLETWLSPVEFSRMFAEMHDPAGNVKGTFVYFGPRRSLTASNADLFFGIRPGQEIDIVLGLVHLILKNGWARNLVPEESENLRRIVADFNPEVVEKKTGLEARFLKDLAVRFARETSIALGGGIEVRHPNATRAQIAINLLNYVSSNFNNTMFLGRSSIFTENNTYTDLLELVDKMIRGNVEILFLHDIDPLSFFPSSSDWDDALESVQTVVCLTSTLDETAKRADYVFPVSTSLESWFDYSPRKGLRGLAQPSMPSIVDSRMAGDFFLSLDRELALLSGGELSTPLDLEAVEGGFVEYLKNKWRLEYGPFAENREFELFWEENLAQGGYWSEEVQRVEKISINEEVYSLDWTGGELDPGNDLLLVPFPTVALNAGKGLERPWLREMPDPVSQNTWDPWVEIHPETAKAIGLKDEEIINIRGEEGEARASLRITDDVIQGIIAMPVGFHVPVLGQYSSEIQANVLSFAGKEPEELSGGLILVSSRVNVIGTGTIDRLPRVQTGFHDNNRGIIKYITQEEFGMEPSGKSPNDVELKAGKDRTSIYPDHIHPGHRWGLAIDLSRCTGCSACVVACYAENNLPVVGRREVLDGREMSWIRIERYDVKVNGSKKVIFLPMMCQHCDNAPCEPVCPVFATYHNPEGLNAQVYARCIGSRYCSNNCPYKVRRFNWFTYRWRDPLDLQLNPDVSIREKGVMEKCTFCYQRIRYARDRAKDEGRQLRDGDIIPACAQTCPSGAIVFGDLNDPDSRVSRMSRRPGGYHVLEQLNTKPAITYLKKVIHERWKT
jgi:molybdopterin-containing oxidoreductase family iron-sulfur binding subunit